MSAPSAATLHVETHGPDPRRGAPVFVMLHGYGASTFTWRHWAPALSARGHVALVDLKGFGGSPKPRDGAYGPHDQARMVVDTLRARGYGPVTLVGHSYGGAVALLVALRLGDEGRAPTGLILVSSPAYAQRLPPFVALSHRPRLASALFGVVGARRIAEWVLRSIVFDPGTVTDEWVDGYAVPLRDPDALPALLATALTLVPPDLPGIIARYPQLDVPAFLLWGRQDRVVPLDMGERLGRDLPRATLRVIERCGHLPHEEHPATTLDMVGAFLDSTEP